GRARAEAADDPLGLDARHPRDLHLDANRQRSDAGAESLAGLRRPHRQHQLARAAAADAGARRGAEVRMIRLAETTEDFELCAEIYAEVEPEKRITAEQVATSHGASL